MKKLLLFIIVLIFNLGAYGQTILIIRGVKINNACDAHKVYLLETHKAEPVKSIDSIELDLNDSVLFAKQFPKYKGKVAIQFVINCQGEIGGGINFILKSENKVLDEALVKFIKSVKKWNPAKLKNQPVDSWVIWHFGLKNGYISIVKH